jgi:hypothetical protein
MPDIYMESESIKKKIKYSEELNLVVVDEKNGNGKNITYSMEELEIIGEGFGEVSAAIHTVKKVFSGTVVRAGKREA